MGQVLVLELMSPGVHGRLDWLCSELEHSVLANNVVDFKSQYDKIKEI